MSNVSLCDATRAVLVVVDVQERLAAAIPGALFEPMIANVRLLLEGAQATGIPVFCSEQYPEGLGRTIAPVADRLPETVTTLEKTCFSCASAEGFNAALEATGRRQVVVCGMETHVCVLATAFDLAARGYEVFVVEDATSARSAVLHANGIARVRHAGVVVTCAESVVFEWLRDAQHPAFKRISTLIKERARTGVAVTRREPVAARPVVRRAHDADFDRPRRPPREGGYDRPWQGPPRGADQDRPHRGPPREGGYDRPRGGPPRGDTGRGRPGFSPRGRPGGPPRRGPPGGGRYRDRGGSVVELLTWFIDIVLHLDQHLIWLGENYGTWIYGILFLIIFCETGLVVTPFLPGDSLLFAAGTVAASGAVEVTWIMGVMVVAALTGDNVNYWVGRYIGPRVFRAESGLLFRREHLDRTETFYRKHGSKTIILARFVPIVRTFVPFVAGVGRMRYARFLGFSVIGALLWVGLLVPLGYFFGNIPVVKQNLSAVILGIIFLSISPGIVEYLRHRARRQAA